MAQASNLLQLLEGIDKLGEIKGQVEALGLDTPDVIAAFEAAIVRAHAQGGEVAYPDDAEHSLLLNYKGGLILFNRRSGRFESIAATDPAAVPLAHVAVGGEITAGDVTEQVFPALPTPDKEPPS